MSDWKEQMREFQPTLQTYYQQRAEAEHLKQIEQFKSIVARDFHCHIAVCSVVGIPPAPKTDSDGFPAEDWTKPGNLFKCIDCHKDTCVDHRFEGRCQACWESLREKVLSGS